MSIIIYLIFRCRGLRPKLIAKYLCWLALFKLSACRPSNLSTSVLWFMYICLQTLSNLLLLHQLIAKPPRLLRLKISGLSQRGAFLGLFNGEPSNGLLHSGAFLAYFNDEPSNGLFHSVPSWLILMMNLLTGFFTGCLLGLFQWWAF